MSVGWNIDDIYFTEFPIIQIKFTPVTETIEDSFSLSQLQKSIPIRLFILAHRIADFGIPSIFVESTPNYLISKQDQSRSNLFDNIPSIIVFDVQNKFDEFNQNESLPLWTEIRKSIWSLQKSVDDNDKFFDLCEEFFDDLQQAITLKTYYQYHLFKPLYFTNYILLPPQTGINDVFLENEMTNPFQFNSIIEPIIIKPVPLFIVNCVKIRWIVQPGLNCVVNPRFGPKVGSFILLPPFRHPLCINSITIEKIETKSFSFSNSASIPKINPKAIPIPITKGMASRPISPALPTINNVTVSTTTIITATTIDKEQTVTFKVSHNNDSNDINTEYVLLTKPSVALCYFFYVKNYIYEYNKTPFRFPYQKKQQPNPNPQQVQNQNQQQYPQYCHFDDLEIFNLDEKDIDNFFSQHFSEEASGQATTVIDRQEISCSFIEDTMPSPYELITEQIFDKQTKKRISRAVNAILLRYNPNVTLSEFFINPDNDTKSLTLFTKRVDLELPKVGYSNSKTISFFRFFNFSNFFGFTNSVSPPIGQMFDFQNVTTFYHLGIPNIFLSQDGCAKEVQADNFLPSWEREKYMPISGPKNGHFIVFYETFGNISSNNSKADSLSAFMSQFCHTYSQLSFGEFSPYPKNNVYNPVRLQPLTKISTSSSSKGQPMGLNSPQTEMKTSKNDIDIDSGTYECDSMKKAVTSFLSTAPLLQFQDYPLVAFIIGGPSCHFFTLESDRKMKSSSTFKENESCPRLHTVYVSPEIAISGTNDQIRALCFEVYSMIRSNKQGPIGNIEFMHKMLKAKAIQNQLAKKIQVQIQQIQSQPHGPLPNQNQEMQIKQMNKQLKHIQFQNFFFKLFFGFRYQPPFLLKQNSDSSSLYILNPEAANNGVNLNIAWDRQSGVSVWINDTGDILHSAETKDFTDLMLMITSAFSYPPQQPQQQQQQQQQVQMPSMTSGRTPLVKKLTITLLEEYLGQSDYEKFMQALTALPAEVDLFTFYHAPSVKALFSEDFKDDVAIFEKQEIANGLRMIQIKQPLNADQMGEPGVSFVFDFPANPESTCYVLSKNHQAYMVSIYKGGGQERLLQFVKTMSHLSWLSVKPGHENRTSSYPPHINALIQQNKTRCSSISQFEFLPAQ